MVMDLDYLQIYMFTSTGQQVDTVEGRQLCKTLGLTWRCPGVYTVKSLTPTMDWIFSDLKIKKVKTADTPMETLVTGKQPVLPPKRGATGEKGAIYVSNKVKSQVCMVMSMRNRGSNFIVWGLRGEFTWGKSSFPKYSRHTRDRDGRKSRIPHSTLSTSNVESEVKGATQKNDFWWRNRKYILFYIPPPKKKVENKQDQIFFFIKPWYQFTRTIQNPK